MSVFIKFTKGNKAGVGHITFEDNEVTRDPLEWNASIGYAGGLHFTTLGNAEYLAGYYTHVRDVRIPEGEFRVTLGADRLKAHSLWLSEARPVADLLKPLSHEQRVDAITAYPNLLCIAGVGAQVVQDCPADKLPELINNSRLREHIATEETVQRFPADRIGDLIRLVPASVKFIQDAINLPVSTLVELVRNGYMVHTVPITEAFRLAEAPALEWENGAVTSWSNGLQVVKTGENSYIGTWTRDQTVLGGLAPDRHCYNDCDHCPREAARGCGCGECRKPTESRPDTHRRVDGFRKGEVVMFSHFGAGLPEGPFESRTKNWARTGTLRHGVMHGEIVTRGDGTTRETYTLGILVTADDNPTPAPREMTEEDMAAVERITPPPLETSVELTLELSVFDDVE
jgi:hypothetical protein